MFADRFELLRWGSDGQEIRPDFDWQLMVTDQGD
jgi:hypothetical protein